MTEQTKRTAPRRRPALIIGLGGTGVKTLRLIAHKAGQGELGEMMSGRRLVLYGIDTDSGAFDKDVRVARRVLEEDGTEDVGAGTDGVPLPQLDDVCSIDTPSIINAMRTVEGVLKHRDARETSDYDMRPEHEAICDWYPTILGDDGPYVGLGHDARRGAGQYRFIGRVGFFLRARDIHDELRRLWGQVSAAGQAAGQDPEVFVICSLSGGTGAGMFWDIGFLLRMLGAKAHVNGCFLMPDAYTGVDLAGRVEANAYAALKELAHYKNWRGGAFRVRYPVGEQMHVYETGPGEPPAFDKVYLFDGARPAGNWSPGDLIDLSCRRIADAVLANLREDVHKLVSTGGNNEAGDGGYPIDRRESRYVFSTMSAVEFDFVDRKQLTRELAATLLEWVGQGVGEPAEREEEPRQTGVRPDWVTPDTAGKSLISVWLKRHAGAPGADPAMAYQRPAAGMFRHRPQLSLSAADRIEAGIGRLRRAAGLPDDYDGGEAAPQMPARQAMALDQERERTRQNALLDELKDDPVLGSFLRPLEETVSSGGAAAPEGVLTLAECYREEIDRAKRELTEARNYLRGLGLGDAGDLDLGALLKTPARDELLPEHAQKADPAAPMLEFADSDEVKKAARALEQLRDPRYHPAAFGDVAGLLIAYLLKVKEKLGEQLSAERSDEQVRVFYAALRVTLLGEAYEEHKQDSDTLASRREIGEGRREAFEHAAKQAMPHHDRDKAEAIPLPKLQALFRPFLLQHAHGDLGPERIRETARGISEISTIRRRGATYRESAGTMDAGAWDSAIRAALNSFRDGERIRPAVLMALFRHALGPDKTEATEADVSRSDELLRIAAGSFVDYWFGRAESMMEQIGGEAELRRRLNLGAGAVFDPGAVQHGPEKEKLVLVPPREVRDEGKEAVSKLRRLFSRIVRSLFSGNPLLRFGHGSDWPVTFHQSLFRAPQEIRGLSRLQARYLAVEARRRPFLHFEALAVQAPDIEPRPEGSKPVYCGNPGCSKDIRDLDRTEITCPDCGKPILNRCGDRDCKADNLLHRHQQDGIDVLGGAPRPRECPSCKNAMRTAWWVCEREEHQHCYISTNSAICELCVEDCNAGKLDPEDICKRPDADRRDCHGCLLGDGCCSHHACSDVCGDVVTIGRDLLCYYRNGVREAEQPVFQKLLKMDDAKRPRGRAHDGFWCPTVGAARHLLFPTCPQDRDDPKKRHHLHRVSDGSFVCSHGHQKRFVECDCCGYPVEVKAGERLSEVSATCPRCTTSLKACRYCSEQTGRIYQQDEANDICPHCTNKMTPDEQSKEHDLAKLHDHPAYCRNLYGCEAGRSLWRTTADRRIDACRVCPPEEGEEGFSLKAFLNVSEQIELCGICLLVHGDGATAPPDGDRPMSAVRARLAQPFPHRVRGRKRTTCGVCGCDLADARRLVEHAALAEEVVETEGVYHSEAGLQAGPTTRFDSYDVTPDDAKPPERPDRPQAAPGAGAGAQAPKPDSPAEAPERPRVDEETLIERQNARTALRVLRGLHRHSDVATVLEELVALEGDEFDDEVFGDVHTKIMDLYGADLARRTQKILRRRLAALDVERRRHFGM